MLNQTIQSLPLYTCNIELSFKRGSVSSGGPFRETTHPSDNRPCSSTGADSSQQWVATATIRAWVRGAMTAAVQRSS